MLELRVLHRAGVHFKGRPLRNLRFKLCLFIKNFYRSTPLCISCSAISDVSHYYLDAPCKGDIKLSLTKSIYFSLNTNVSLLISPSGCLSYLTMRSTTFYSRISFYTMLLSGFTLNPVQTLPHKTSLLVYRISNYNVEFICINHVHHYTSKILST